MIRRTCRRALERRLRRRAQPIGEAALDRPAIVLAPHPDDEVLGCGGLVALKRRRGVPVTVVFLTDGAASHGDAPTGELAAIRRREALAATGELGVGADEVRFLDLPDGGLTDAAVHAIDDLDGLVGDRLGHGTQLIVPHPLEPPPDHRAAHDVADALCRRRGAPTEALLYAVWWWDQWPWTDPLAPPRGRHPRRRIVATAMRGRLGLGPASSLTTSVDVSTVLDVKRRALSAHASQVARPEGSPDHLVLADVADGEWLDLLLRPTERYARTTLGGPS